MSIHPLAFFTFLISEETGVLAVYFQYQKVEIISEAAVEKSIFAIEKRDFHRHHITRTRFKKEVNIFQIIFTNTKSSSNLEIKKIFTFMSNFNIKRLIF